jgi:hypothetical protein
MSAYDWMLGFLRKADVVLQVKIINAVLSQNLGVIDGGYRRRSWLAKINARDLTGSQRQQISSI